MGDKTGIEWTDSTWNPVSGCTKISPGCDNCYAETVALRFPATYPNGFAVTLQPHRLDQPLRWTAPRRVFVNSMSDLFHKDVPLDYLDQVFDVMERADRHTFQVLTKRSSLMRDYVYARYSKRVPVGTVSLAPVPPNVWLGVSVEDHRRLGRVKHLRDTPARVRFLSLEPLIGRIGPFDLTGIHWCIVGAESGTGARPMRDDWVREIRDQCAEAGVALFVKQFVRGGRKLKRDEFPEDLRQMEWPDAA